MRAVKRALAIFVFISFSARRTYDGLRFITTSAIETAKHLRSE
jgi:hypothetical protein